MRCCKLIWLSTVRPDLDFPVEELARGMSSPTLEHQAQLKHLLRCVKRAASKGLQLRPTYQITTDSKNPIEVHCYSDSDWAGCQATHKSTTGCNTTVYSSTVQHCSRTQATVALSSTEAETDALASGCAELIYVVH